jgi:hypothetical protein
MNAHPMGLGDGDEIASGNAGDHTISNEIRGRHRKLCVSLGSITYINAPRPQNRKALSEEFSGTRGSKR